MATSISLPDELVEFARAAANRKGLALVMGSAVVDLALGRVPARLAVTISGLDAKATAELIARASGARAGARTSFLVDGGRMEVVVSTHSARAGRRPSAASASLPGMELAATTLFRDAEFTADAVGYDIAGERFEDPCGGLEDIRSGRLRSVDTLAEPKPAAPLRGAALASRAGLTADRRTIDLMRGALAANAPLGSIWAELESMLTVGSRPSHGLEALRQFGALHVVAPELAALDGCPQESRDHPEGDAWVHTKMAVNAARLLAEGLERDRSLALALAVLLHATGKPSQTTLVDDRVVAGGHAFVGAGVARATLERLDGEVHAGPAATRHVASLVGLQHVPLRLFRRGRALRPKIVGWLEARVDIELLYRLSLACALGRGEAARDAAAPEWFREAVDMARRTSDAPAPLIGSAELLPLGWRPGPATSDVVADVYRLQLDGSIPDRPAALRAAETARGAQVPGLTVRPRAQ